MYGCHVLVLVVYLIICQVWGTSQGAGVRFSTRRGPTHHWCPWVWLTCNRGVVSGDG